MTYSDCWISTVDDTEFRAVLTSQRDTERKEKLHLLPPALANGLWINIVREWAHRHNLAVERTGPLESQVAVSRAELLQFVDEIFWRKEEARDQEERETLTRVERVERLRAHVDQFFRDDRTYLIVADEL